MSNTVTDVTDDNYTEVITNSEVPVFIDFWAEWCGPCKALSPKVDAAAEKYGNSLTVAKVNIDQSPGIAAQYGVRSLPTMVMVKGGDIQEIKVGSASQSEVESLIDRNI